MYGLRFAVRSEDTAVCDVKAKPTLMSKWGVHRDCSGLYG